MGCIEFNSIVRQYLQVRVINSIGSVVFIEDLENYIGEYKKQISLKEYSKTIYFLEIQIGRHLQEQMQITYL